MNDGQEYEFCPYDATHYILKHRMATHVAKCRLQHPNSNKVTCPYNRLHIVDKFEIEEHKKNCESNDTILNVICIDGPRVPVGTVPLQELINHETLADDEDWNGNHPTYNPDVATQERDIVRAPNAIESKAVKKQRKKRERERMAHIENQAIKNPSVQRKPEPSTPLRAPRNAAKALTLANNEPDFCSYFESTMKLTKDLQKEVPVKANPVKKESVKKEPMQQVPIKKEPMQKVPMKKEPMQQVPIKKEPMQKVPMKKEPMQQVPIKKEPMQKVPIKKEPVKEPVKKEPKQTINSENRPGETSASENYIQKILRAINEAKLLDDQAEESYRY